MENGTRDHLPIIAHPVMCMLGQATSGTGVNLITPPGGGQGNLDVVLRMGDERRHRILNSLV